jgi:uncharacterized protein
MNEGDSMTSSNREPNRLVNEKSPYLLQHAYNPVDWYPWGDEAFAKANAEDKPIFLSIGYSTCHWCHVMAKESFEDEEVADILNRYFVSIKVDREERPDIDHIYMTVCQALTGSGGWPLSILMTPGKKPFFAGTYFPKHSRLGMTGFVDILKNTAEAWNTDKESLVEVGAKITRGISEYSRDYEETGEISEDIIRSAYNGLKSNFDDIYGGFSSQPKFPTPHNLMFLMRYFNVSKEPEALKMVEKTLQGMYNGGIFDHIGGGFCRYATDKKWLVPHFEKMLYDNAMLIIAYTECYQITKNEIYKAIAYKTLDYVLRDMTDEAGGFYSAQDADSEGQEGKFYVWDPQEIKDVLGDEDGLLFCKYYGITEHGNFEGKSIPNRLYDCKVIEKDRELIEGFTKTMLEYRKGRVHPHKDDKILTGWNGLMIAAMAIAGRVFRDDRYTMASQKAFGFIKDKLIREDGRLLARYRDGEAAYLAYLDDYAYLIWGLIELYETTYDPEYLEYAIKLNSNMLKLFWDKENSGLFLYGSDGEKLIFRPKDIYDGAIPSGNSVALNNIIRLARLTGDTGLDEIANRQIGAFASEISENPNMYTYFLLSCMFTLYTDYQIVIAGKGEDNDVQEMVDMIHEMFLPLTVVLVYYPTKEHGSKLEDLAPYIKSNKPKEGKQTAYVCRHFMCMEPITDVKELQKVLTT